MGFVRRNVNEGAFREIPAADILVDEDESFLGEMHGGAKDRPVVIHSVRPHRIGRALQHKGVGLRSILGNVDAGEQFHAVAHGDAVIVFGVARAGGFQLLLTLFLGGLREERDGKCRQIYQQPHSKSDHWE